MVPVNDIAAYILQKKGKLTAMKLQKLVYYSQAWSLVWDEAQLFPERIEAWANGPVVPELYKQHRGEFEIEKWSSGNHENLSKAQKDTVVAVLKFYGEMTAQQLSDLTHREPPWVEARAGLSPDTRGENEITPASMHTYYSGLIKN